MAEMVHQPTLGRMLLNFFLGDMAQVSLLFDT